MIWGSPYFDWALRTRVFSEDALQELGPALHEPERWLLSLFNSGRDPVDAMTRTHFGSILPDDFLVKIDRASMAVSLEMRSPFLDHRMIEFAFGRVPSRWKVSLGQTRILERKLAERWLPADLDLNRKQGFSIPLDSWLRSSRCRELEELRPCLPDAITTSVVDDLIRGEMRGRANGSRIFSLLMLGLACRNMEVRP
jgi:asparagine synthase (glutamine-hydrolysing)